MKTFIFKIAIIILSLLSNYIILGQCASSSNIYSFVYNGHSYEVVQENKTWVAAAQCAVERGGFLTEITTSAEQDAVFGELISSQAAIDGNNSIAQDGGNSAYLWIGGNDLSNEGVWVWDGNNDTNGVQFWQGDFLGNAFGGQYNNWGQGQEPDDFNGQDALGISLDGWVNGSPGQWNDVSHTNTLYYIIEYNSVLDVKKVRVNDKIQLSPNPVNDFLMIRLNNRDINSLTIFNSIGQKLKSVNLKNDTVSKKIDLTDLNKGIYFVKAYSKNGKHTITKIIK